MSYELKFIDKLIIDSNFDKWYELDATVHEIKFQSKSLQTPFWFKLSKIMLANLKKFKMEYDDELDSFPNILNVISALG